MQTSSRVFTEKQQQQQNQSNKKNLVQDRFMMPYS